MTILNRWILSDSYLALENSCPLWGFSSLAVHKQQFQPELLLCMNSKLKNDFKEQSEHEKVNYLKCSLGPDQHLHELLFSAATKLLKKVSLSCWEMRPSSVINQLIHQKQTFSLEHKRRISKKRINQIKHDGTAASEFLDNFSSWSNKNSKNPPFFGTFFWGCKI